MHAICDAVLGALGEADIGHFSPNTDPRWRGAPSRVFLEEAAKQTARRGGRFVNVDATVIAEAPKIYPHVAEMKKHIAAALGVNEKQIGLKATTNELMDSSVAGKASPRWQWRVLTCRNEFRVPVRSGSSKQTVAREIFDTGTRNSKRGTQDAQG